MRFDRAKYALLFAGLMIVLTGCARPYGDFTFLWEFDGDDSCASARVAEVDVALIDSRGRVHVADTFTCTGAGLTLRDFPEGTYVLLLDAYSYRGLHVLQTETEFFLEGGVLTDLGVLNLERLGGAANGDLTFVWSFDGETRCSRAGVSEVDVAVTDEVSGETLLLETADCVGEGLYLLDLPPVRVQVDLDGYDGRGNRLYGGSAIGRVPENAITDLGVIDLLPVN